MNWKVKVLILKFIPNNDDMKFLTFLICIFLSTSTDAQAIFSEKDAKQIIATFFEGFHEGDTLKMRLLMAEDIVMQTAMTNKEGKEFVQKGDTDGFLKAIASRTKDQVWKERLLDYNVQINGNLAHVWTPYEFWYNGVLSHTGANSFTLAKLENGWKIIHIIDSRVSPAKPESADKPK